ncbi:MAG TPA: hypothetical protein VK539_13370 [Myxococcaceae bacterium]|nr:hypothetical protein [Myxococcaceae bacterium]
MPSQKAKTNGSAKLSEQFVAFIDLLGFREEMARIAKHPDEAAALLERFQSTVAETVRKVLIPSQDLPIWEYRGFTDNFVIASPVGRHNLDGGEGGFGTISSQAAEFQFRLALQGWFLRGGFTMGSFFMDDLTVFGPALVDAYVLESSYARDPRIVLSSSVAKLIKKQLKYYHPNHEAPQNNFILRDIDGHPFINYLYIAIDYELDVETIKQHKIRVEEKLRTHKNNPTIWAKYRWVASYHDYFCKTWISKHYDELRISRSALAASPRRLVETS